MIRLDSQEKVVKHLEMIEAIIQRLATTSSIIKGWMISIIVAIVAIFHSNSALVLVISIPLVVFFATLDAFYLNIERKYRCLYDQVRIRENTDFSMKPPKDKFGFFKALISPSILVTYLLVILVLVVVCIIFDFVLGGL